MSEVQAVLFDKDMWTRSSSLRELYKLGFHPIKPVHETANKYRYRMEDPNMYKRLRTKHGQKGITFIIGFK